MKKLILLFMTGALSLAVVTPAEAESTKTIVKRAVRITLYRDYDISYPSISCRKYAKRRYTCRWSGISIADVNAGNVDGWKGTATARWYPATRSTFVRLYVIRYGE